MGKAVKDMAIPGDALMIAIYRGDSFIVPHGNTVMFPGDQIMFFAEQKDHSALNDLFGMSGL